MMLNRLVFILAAMVMAIVVMFAAARFERRIILEQLLIGKSGVFGNTNQAFTIRVRLP